MKHKKPSTGLYKILFLLITIIFSFCLLGCGDDDKSASALSSTNSAQEGTHSNEKEDASSQYQQETIEEPKEPIVRQALLSFTGDLMVHSYQYEESYDSATGTYEFDHNFEAVKKYFDKADYVLGNLETVLGGDEIGAQDFP